MRDNVASDQCTHRMPNDNHFSVCFLEPFVGGHRVLDPVFGPHAVQILKFRAVSSQHGNFKSESGAFEVSGDVIHGFGLRGKSVTDEYGGVSRHVTG